MKNRGIRLKHSFIAREYQAHFLQLRYYKRSFIHSMATTLAGSATRRASAATLSTGEMNRRGLLEFMFPGVFVTLVSCKREPTINRSSLPFGSVDLPVPKSTVRGPIQVAGWALADQPIREVAVYIDGKYLTAASTKMERPDVVLAKPGYKGARNSGYTLIVDTSSLAAGWHEIVVQARAEDGATRDLSTVPVLVQH